MGELPTHSNVKFRIAYIMQDCPTIPHCKVCGNNCAWSDSGFSKWCGVKCRNKDPDLNKILSEKQTANAEIRNKKRAITLAKQGKTSPFQGHRHTEKSKNQIGETSAKSLAASKLVFYTENPGKIHPSDRPHWTSKGEQDIVNWLRNLGYEVKHKDHKLLDGKEADIYIPSSNLAIEYDGIWWHREDSKLYVKQEEAAKKGVRLIRIFEDEWEQKQPIIKSIILAKLGKFEHRYYARKLGKKEISGKEAYAFMLENHLQGPKSTQRHIALCDDSEIIAMVSISNKNELERFATKLNCQVVGGLAKLISNEHDLFTYVDRRFSPIAEETGYNQMGQFLGSTQPGYFWVKNNHREPRWQFQKHKLEKKLGHSVDLSKTETQIMEEEGYYKLYDCGHWKFMLNPLLMPYKGKIIIEKPIINAPYIPLF